MAKGDIDQISFTVDLYIPHDSFIVDMYIPYDTGVGHVTLLWKSTNNYKAEGFVNV